MLPRNRRAIAVFFVATFLLSSFTTFGGMRRGGRMGTTASAWMETRTILRRGGRRSPSFLVRSTMHLSSSKLQEHARSSIIARETSTLPSIKKDRIRLYASTSTSIHRESGTTTTQQEQTEENKIYEELKWVSQEIRKHDAFYYTQQPELSDDEFDALVRREEALTEEHPHLLKQWQDESGQGIAATRQGRVGTESELSTSDVTTGHSSSSATAAVITALAPRLKRIHVAPMLSLDNVHNNEQVYAWLKRIPKVLDELDETTTRVTILTEPKLDGVSLSLRYQRASPSSPVSSSSSSSEMEFQLEWASTRGDGRQGQDVTPAIAAIPNIPSTIRLDDSSIGSLLPDTLEIRGEIVLPNTEFADLAKIAPNATFVNSRNAASGILLRKETKLESDKVEATQLRSKLHFYAYDMTARIPLGLSGLAIRKFLSKHGFSIPLPIATTEFDLHFNDTLDGQWLNDDNIAPMRSYYDALQVHRIGKITTKEYDWGDFEMDGCVHKLSEHDLRHRLGRSMKSPKWAAAHKFPPQVVVTPLRNITIQIGRTGALTPVAILDPVEVGGVTIQRATLHNFGHLQRIMGGIAEGDNAVQATSIPVGTPVLVRRAGDVIPQVIRRMGKIVSPETAAKDDDSLISLEAPTHCPACGSPVILEEIAASSSNSTAGQVARCGGPPLLCPPRAVTSLGHAFSRDAMDVTGLSEARIQHLIDAGLLRFPGDVYQWSDDEWNRIQELPGWGEKSCQNLRATSRRVATDGISLGRFIYSLGARHVGKYSSELVASSYGTKEIFLNALEVASKWKEKEDTAELDDNEKTVSQPHPFAALEGKIGIGPALIQSLVSFAKTKELMNAARDLANVVRIQEEEVIDDQAAATTAGETSDSAHPWQDMRVVFTGSIPNFTRSEAHTSAKKLGAKATPGSVSKSTDLVIYGDKGGKKLDQARSLGIRIMTAEEFANLVNETL